ncbi:Cj0814 family flagellar-dependent secreted protein, partial [Campylobacter hyointestinalis]
MLVTQNQSSLSWNSSFSKQKQGNSNETFKLEFPAEIKTQSDIKTGKKLEINGIEYLEFHSSNVEINSAMNSSVSSAVSSATAVSQATTSTATAYGYSVDSKGFMGADFNAAAGLPAEFQIHKSTLDEFVEVSHKNTAWNATLHKNFIAAQQGKITEPSYYKNIDVAANFGAYYAQPQSVVRTSKSTFSTSDLADLPKGFSTNDSAFSANNVSLGVVSNVYKNNYELNKINDLNESLPAGVSGVYIQRLDFSPKTSDMEADDFTFNPDMSVYERDDGLYSIPGAGAEVLSDRVRDIVAPKKCSSQKWLDIHKEAHSIG